MKRDEPDLTVEQLEMARRHLSRPGWPPTLEAVLADPLRAGCVRGLARSFSRGGVATGQRYVPPTPQHAPPVPPTPPSTPPARQQTSRKAPPPFSTRMAAANDLQD